MLLTHSCTGSFFVSVRDLNRAAVRSTANKAIVWLCLARGSQPVGMSNRVHAANTFVYWFFFVSVRDLNRVAVRSIANKAIVWLCLARGSHRLGMSNKVHAANTFVYWFFFCLCAGFEQGGGAKHRKQSHSMALFIPRVPPARNV